MKITIDASKKIINYLDVEPDLNSEKHSPYMKPGNVPLYVHAKSNNPPNIVRSIEKSINQRLTETVFCKAVPEYKTALEKSGYDFNLKFQKKGEKRNRTRKIKIVWFKSDCPLIPNQIENWRQQ